MKKLNLSLDLTNYQLIPTNEYDRFRKYDNDRMLRGSLDSSEDTGIDMSCALEDVNAIALPPSIHRDPKQQPSSQVKARKPEIVLHDTNSMTNGGNAADTENP